ncbi:MAG: YebO family protein [Acidobacteriia bacterium]|nr:YebO family protein [Terriglobia bacterium]
MTKQRYAIHALAFAAFASLSIGWAADVPPPDANSGSQAAQIQQLKAQLDQQQRQIEALRVALEAQKKALEQTESAVAPAEPEHKMPNLGDVASTTPFIPRGVAPAVAAAVPPPPPQAEAAAQPSPLQIHLGDATITPVGFMDITNTFRSTNAGSSLQTNFGSFPYNNTVQGRMTEDKWSAENSRLGLRVDAKVHGANVLGYFEGDFVGLGNAANNTQVSSNSMLFRIRQYYVDVRKGFWEVLAGQAWSMLLPNRRGMSPLPADLFYTQVVDVNYTNGLFWGRIPGIRVIGHPSKTVAFGLALENSSQYFGGSGGGGTPVLPAALATSYNTELDNGVNNDRTIANVHPDIIAKFTVDPSSKFHFEMGGVESTVRLFNQGTNQYFTKAGGGVTLSLNAEIVKNLRVVTANYYNDGGGRYIFGAAPNFIVRADGSPSLVHSASTVSGFEASIKNFAPYIYYGGVYIDRNTALDANGTTRIGYGFPGSGNGQNRSIQEITTGWTHTIWRDGKYGALQWMAQYAYLFRNPWSVAANAPKNAHESVLWFNLRYVLPGSAPTIQY